jgi:hypothetical protein
LVSRTYRASRNRESTPAVAPYRTQFYRGAPCAPAANRIRRLPGPRRHQPGRLRPAHRADSATGQQLGTRPCDGPRLGRHARRPTPGSLARGAHDRPRRGAAGPFSSPAKAALIGSARPGLAPANARSRPEPRPPGAASPLTEALRGSTEVAKEVRHALRFGKRTPRGSVEESTEAASPARSSRPGIEALMAPTDAAKEDRHRMQYPPEQPPPAVAFRLHAARSGD